MAGRRARRGERPLPDEPVPISSGRVELRSDSDGVLLLIDGVESSHLDPDDPEHLVFEYMQQMMSVLRITHEGTDRLRAVHLGAAGCALARAIDSAWPEPRQIAVEIDERLAALVREWFDLPRSPRLRIRVGDAREQLRTLAPATADVIVRDAFAERSVPAHLRTVEFTDEVADRLSPTGVYLANTADEPPLRDARREVATVTAVFPHAVVIAEPGVLRGRRYGNLVVAASHAALERRAVARLTRSLRSLPVPATLLAGADVPDFVAGATPFSDASTNEGAAAGDRPET